MLRTQIYLPTSQVKFLKRKAIEDETSLSDVIRRLVEKEVQQEKKPKTKEKNPGTILLYLAKTAEKEGWKGPKDLATNLDKYLYGEKK